LRHDVEVEVEEQILSLVERRRTTMKEGVEARQALLTIQQEERVALGRCSLASHLRRLVSLPDEEVARGMTSVEGLDEESDLIPIPDISSLKLRQKDLLLVHLRE